MFQNCISNPKEPSCLQTSGGGQNHPNPFSVAVPEPRVLHKTKKHSDHVSLFLSYGVNFVSLNKTKTNNTSSCSFLLHSVFPYEVTMLTRVLSMLPHPRLDEGVISRVDAVMTQCSLNDLNTIALAFAKWVRSDPSYRRNTPNKYVHLLQTLNRCGHERLQTADRLDLLLEELRYISGDWFEEMLVEETMVTLQRMVDQIQWTNVPELALFLTRINQLCPPLMDRIASVAIKDIDKVI